MRRIFFEEKLGETQRNSEGRGKLLRQGVGVVGAVGGVGAVGVVRVVRAVGVVGGDESCGSSESFGSGGRG